MTYEGLRRDRYEVMLLTRCTILSISLFLIFWIFFFSFDSMYNMFHARATDTRVF